MSQKGGEREQREPKGNQKRAKREPKGANREPKSDQNASTNRSKMIPKRWFALLSFSHFRNSMTSFLELIFDEKSMNKAMPKM